MQTWRAAPWTARVGIDCNHCNNVRLEYIERQAIRFVGPMAFSQREGGIPVPARQWLAAFALRMVAVGQYTHAQHRPVPRRHREYLVTNQAAPPSTAVWLWRYDFAVGQLMDVNIHCASIRAIRKGEPLPAWNNAYHGLLRVGALIMEVASRTDGRGYPVEPLAPGRMIPIWPLDIAQSPQLAAGALPFARGMDAASHLSGRQHRDLSGGLAESASLDIASSIHFRAQREPYAHGTRATRVLLASRGRSLALRVFGVLSEDVHIVSAERSRSPVIDDIHEIEQAHTQLLNVTLWPRSATTTTGTSPTLRLHYSPTRRKVRRQLVNSPQRLVGLLRFGLLGSMCRRFDKAGVERPPRRVRSAETAHSATRLISSLPRGVPR